MIESGPEKKHATQDATVAAGPSQPPAPPAAAPPILTGDAGTGEIGGPKGPNPTRYGDWERKGRCVDF